MLSLSSSIGGALGYTVTSAIYTNTFPNALLRALPESAEADYAAIYLGVSTAQLQYSPGSDVRNAIDYAWAHSQKYECIATTVIVALAFPAVAVWQNYNVGRMQLFWGLGLLGQISCTGL
ncbi:hypothetical protein UA08_06152 [Talaromyces atroroseus]|uniref:Uncharacterized protein n=1 Tax=Talaromyces atroroseus TaxID=1441469 RepID=A0A225ADE1_TALAT|nr:hypothetical protein UA08_06152 [Talaromyces atroroseus]OKL58450.1 hypothetical protein UA08_06152 [Talaromyces atroroseus]